VIRSICSGSGGGDRGPPQVGVEQDAGGVHHRAGPAPLQRGEPGDRDLHRIGVVTVADAAPRLVEGVPGHRDEQRAGQPGPGGGFQPVRQGVDTRKIPQCHVAQPTRPGKLGTMRLSSLLFTVFVVTPVVEIALFVVVGGRIGLGPTLLVVVVTAILGASLVSRQSRAEWSRVRAEFAAGSFPGRPLAHSAMILVAGTLLITPGFLTDAIGFALLIPGVREAVRQWGLRRFRNRTTVL